MANYKGIEEALSVAEGFKLGCDYKSAFLFLKISTGQIFTQLFCEETKKPSYYRSDDMLYVGKLLGDITYDDIVSMTNRALAEKEAWDNEYLEWYEENERRKKHERSS